jgi:cbb3-type cytochrome oxidase subunit 3
MEKVIEFLKKNWVIVLIGIVIIYILYKNKKNNELARRLEDNRQQALIEFDKFSWGKSYIKPINEECLRELKMKLDISD